MPRQQASATDPDIVVEAFVGDRRELRALFELAEDSSQALDRYVEEGVVLVAKLRDERDEVVVGHVQITMHDDQPIAEIKNMAVAEPHQRTGVGRRLVSAALDRARRQGAARLEVATGAADVGNLRFYQRQGFRFSAIERDAFTPDAGYPTGIVIDGIELRDRVWLDREIT
jgi:GNAT superfamily N-acetyltransferase